MFDEDIGKASEIALDIARLEIAKAIRPLEKRLEILEHEQRRGILEHGLSQKTKPVKSRPSKTDPVEAAKK